MARKLAIVALIGLSASAVCIGGAAAIGGGNFGEAWDFSALGDGPACQTVAGAKATSRDLDWDGSDHVTLSVGGTARYVPGTDEKLHARGDPQTLAHLALRHGTITFDCNGWHRNHSDLTLVLPGREFRRFSIAGHGTLLLQKLDQPMVEVHIAGSGAIKADGKVEHADILIAGSGDADLSQLTAEVATVHIAGSGTSDIAPTQEADIHIAGSGDVNLYSNPRRLQTHIVGSGRIRNVGAGD